MTRKEKQQVKKPKTKSEPTVQEKFQITRDEMARKLIEREDEIDLVLTALICGENPLLVGEPGTAKSMLLDTLLEWMGPGTKRFTILFNKFTTPEEVFGPISVQGLTEDVYRRVTTGKLPEADVAFADEIFKASTAILNTMLRILNERVYENGDGALTKVPLQICVAASNEWPNDQEGGKELGALFDRFLFRKSVRTVSSPGGKKRLLWERNHKPQLTTMLDPHEIKEARRDAKGLEWTEDAKAGMEEILDALNADGIFPGDRRKYKSIDAVRAFAYLNGAKLVEREHLEILGCMLWDCPGEQEEKCKRIVSKLANPTGARIIDCLSQMKDILAKNQPSEAVPKLREIQKELTKLPCDKANEARHAAALEHVTEEIRLTYNKVIGVT